MFLEKKCLPSNDQEKRIFNRLIDKERMEHQLNKIFSLLICVQFLVSTLNLCISGFYMTKVNVGNAYFWVALVNLNTFIFQLFLQCFFGELMTRKSLSVADEIYKMDWNLLNIQSKQKLILIMMRANRPMQLTGYSLITMSIETFCRILKTSYSAFNLVRNVN
ncbi:putative odorant receptor 92a [Leptopilina heterotoma]|uniref:putative odorant receptor 92a n=1 Tax=Leptopilina heterotoma TaxID=63436 RepID=UPI001CA99C23|nr:putative odorant receptor 92a [Leptopilina heterotoma]